MGCTYCTVWKFVILPMFWSVLVFCAWLLFGEKH